MTSNTQPTEPPVKLTAGGPRSILLIRQAYFEEAHSCPPIDERTSPIKLLYPRSYLNKIAALDHQKKHDYCFVGGLYRPETFQHRRWILDFARHKFTERSYFQLTDGYEQHVPLGKFDNTHPEGDTFVPKEVPPIDRGFFHEHFFRIMCASQFTLCPAGDAPWSMRFFEAIMCHSIPIVSDFGHAGRNDLERSIGYRVLLADDEHIYDETIAKENFQLFLRHQTLLAQ